MGGHDLVLDEMPPQWRWRTLVKKNPHSNRGHRTACGMLEHGANLVERDSRKPFDNIRQRGARFEILEQGSNRHAGTPEDPGSAHTLRIPLHRGTGRPVNHAIPVISYTSS